jgi:D-serine dehydratase
MFLPTNLDRRLLLAESHFWPNPFVKSAREGFSLAPTSQHIVDSARADWNGFAPLLARLFPELEASQGHVVSPLLKLNDGLARREGLQSGRTFIKADHLLPLTGTVKSRGGLFEVLKYAEATARSQDLLTSGETSLQLVSEAARAHFAKLRVLTGSTGNLGYSVGLSARALGFNTEIHMSSDAKSWKVERLRRLGAKVIQHEGDFSYAVSRAREAANEDQSYFVDDENSLSLFQGYSAASFEVAKQLSTQGVEVSLRQPLFVYIPCGVGGAAGGITFGLKHLFGDAVYCVFVEPVAAPSVMLQTACGPEHPISVYDIGLDNRTVADGMAVASASLLAVRHVQHLVDGFATVADPHLLAWCAKLWGAEQLKLEPSAAAGFEACRILAADPKRPDTFDRATHLVWTTGGSQFPDEEFRMILEAGSLLETRHQAAQST